MAGATLEPGDDLSRINALSGSRPPGVGTPDQGNIGGENPAIGALKQIGATLTSSAQRRFRTQRFGENEWLPRAVPNIAGIISDLTAGSTPPDRRFTSRPALSDTGRLRGSITWRLIDSKTVQVGSNLEYAGRAQFGGESTLPITQQVKTGLADLIRRGKDINGVLAALMNEDSVTITVPARIYVGIDDDDERDIARIVERWYQGKPYDIQTT